MIQTCRVKQPAVEEVVKSHFKCKSCGKEREAKYFSLHAGCREGHDTSRCKPCKKAKWDWERVSYEKRMYNRVKQRSKRRGILFELKIEDIVLPEECPVFHTPFIYGDPDWTYSIDRINPNKGYSPDNIQILSNKANRLKNNASIEDLETVLDFMKQQLT